MSTGGLAIALGETPHQFHGLYHIGLTLYIINVVLFLLITLLTLLRLTLHPNHVLASLTHPSESLFISALPLSLSVLLAGLQIYTVTRNPSPASPWLLNLIYTLYIIYTVLSLITSTTHTYFLIAHSPVRPIPHTPALFLPGYSAMLTGTVASVIAPSQPPQRAALVVLTGVAWQGFGWCVSFLAVGMYLKSLLDTGLPGKKMRPGMFIPVGAAAYSIVALVGLAAGGVPAADAGAGGFFDKYPLARDALVPVAVFVGLFLYVFAFWLFALAVVANLQAVLWEGGMEFGLGWWAFVFPNVGFTLSTSVLGRELESEAILWVASGMTGLLVVIWMVSAVACVRAVWNGSIVWPGRDEDKDR
ncbi:TehA Tellurite resistance protein [Pyrenophora tritici-repentis]|nr:TehA Tellurite resistance protein and related permease [Pyrenophora tritici-repentis]KAI0576891.1 TehA Tellurite resistance protein and related permease [Pyrenophora tritici-repentis]KAI0587629.1 TehA Tellurite resistance protein and related permease [Pyrenophora tritici-repentis]KAI0611010.1 TehA Tellurite resistance protein and related permease [Pyrenophora tritici-repentis]KAI0623696.1 TehA Tellurite resistance protein and related permease [Pyrenophora tritici-repentis]